MKNFRKHLLIGITALGLGIGSVAAYAEHSGCDGMRSGHHASAADHQKFAERMQQHMAKRQAKLHDELKLNASQEAAWSDYVAAIKPVARPEPAKRPDRAEFAKLPAPERMDRMLAMMKDGEARMETRVAATKTFYAVLTPEQQKTFDAALHHGRRHHGKHH